MDVLTDDLRASLHRIIAESEVADGELTHDDLDGIVGLVETWLEREMTVIPDWLWLDMVRVVYRNIPTGLADLGLLMRIRQLDPETLHKVEAE